MMGKEGGGEEYTYIGEEDSLLQKGCCKSKGQGVREERAGRNFNRGHINLHLYQVSPQQLHKSGWRICSCKLGLRGRRLRQKLQRS